MTRNDSSVRAPAEAAGRKRRRVERDERVDEEEKEEEEEDAGPKDLLRRFLTLTTTPLSGPLRP